MEFISIIMSLLLAFFMFLGQILTAVLKLVPIAFLFDIIEKFVIWGNQLLQMMITNELWTLFMMLIFIPIIWYVILIWLLHLVTNINIFNNLLVQLELSKWLSEWAAKKKVKWLSLNKEVLDNFREWFISFIKKIKSNNKWDNTDQSISQYNLIRQSFVLLLLLFQWWIIRGKDFFKEVKDIFSWTKNLAIVIILIIWFGFILNYEKTYINQSTWEQIVVSNWYDFIKQKSDYLVSLWWDTYSFITDNMENSLSYTDNKIKIIARIYYYLSLMPFLTDVDLVEVDKWTSEIKISWWSVNNWSTSTDSTKNDWLNESFASFYNKKWLSFVWSEALPNNGIYFRELINTLYWKSNASIVSSYTSELKSCLSQTTNNKTLLTTKFIPQSAYNNRYFNEYVWWKLASNTSSNTDFNKIQLLTQNWRTYMKPWDVALLVNNYNWILPWSSQDFESDKIWLFFIIWKQWANYLIDQWLYNIFVSQYSSHIIETSDKEFNSPHMMFNYWNNVVNFCNWYALYKSHSVDSHNITFESQVWPNGWQIRIANFDNLLNWLYEKNLWILKSDNNKEQLAGNLAFNSDYYLSDFYENRSLEEQRNWNIFKKYFYMFWDPKEYNIMYTLMLSNWIDDWSVNSLLAVFNRSSVENKKDEVLLKDQEQLNKIWLSFWFQKSIDKIYDKITNDVKEKYWTSINANVYNDVRKTNLRNNLLLWYKWETFDPSNQYSFMSNFTLRNYSNNFSLIEQWWQKVNWDLSTINSKKVMFFAKWIDLLNSDAITKNENGLLSSTYQKVWVIMWIIPLIETDVPLINVLLFIFYLWVLWILFLLMWWFSWILQIVNNYYVFKSWKTNEEFNFKDEVIELLVRLVIFILMLKIYFLFTIL